MNIRLVHAETGERLDAEVVEVILVCKPSEASEEQPACDHAWVNMTTSGSSEKSSLCSKCSQEKREPRDE